MPTLDEQIAQRLAESLRSGEMQSAPSWGKPLELSDGYAATPDELKLPYKILKDAGVVPAEVQLMQRIARLKRRVEAATLAGDDATELQQQLSELRQSLALRMERMRLSSR